MKLVLFGGDRAYVLKLNNVLTNASVTTQVGLTYFAKRLLFGDFSIGQTAGCYATVSSVFC